MPRSLLGIEAIGAAFADRQRLRRRSQRARTSMAGLICLHCPGNWRAILFAALA
jgi:hypothetical protein